MSDPPPNPPIFARKPPRREQKPEAPSHPPRWYEKGKTAKHTLHAPKETPQGENG